MLKKIITGFLILGAIVLLASILAICYFLTHGKVIIQNEVKKNLGAETRIGSLSAIPPFTFIVNNLNIGESISVAKISISPSILSLLRGDIILNSLLVDKPNIKVTRNTDNTFDFGIVMPKGESKNFYAAKLRVSNATIEFLDKRISEQNPFKTQVSRLDIDISRPSVLKLAQIQFKGVGTLEAQTFQKIGDIAFSGTADLLSKSMNAQIKLSRIFLPYLTPYYKKFLKKELKAGEMSAQVDTIIKDNDLNADCHIELNNMAFQQPAASDSSAENIEQPQDLTVLAFDSMLSAKGNAIFDFSISTKLDKPKFEHIKLKGTFLQNKIQEAMDNPEETMAKIKVMSKDFKAIGKEFKKMFKNQEPETNK